MTKTTPRNRIYGNIIETIGGTPLVRLNKLSQGAGESATILAKLEYFNPLSSVKDRTALGMIEAAEKDGILRPGGCIVEPTSGNTGIGLAFIAAVRGYRLVLTMPDNMSAERRKMLAYLGAEIVLTPAAEGMAGALRKAEEIAKERSDVVMLQQFANPANPAIHRETTAEEIWTDTNGSVDVFIAGVGTGGTIQGVTEGLRKHKPGVRAVAVQPAGSPVLSGGAPGVHKIQGIGANFIPSIINREMLDEIISITDDEAMETARRLARQEGILAGISSGAAVAAALKVANRPDMANKTIVVLLPDTAERYLSTALFTDGACADLSCPDPRS
ncbi:MAG: cysteine synthase A [Pseudomonadota bacterium]